VRHLARALCLAAAGAAPRPAGADAPQASDFLTPAQIMARYSAALAAAKKPKAMSFDYSVEQLGLRNLVQTHHVYRSALDERDETRIVDGSLLPRPAVRIIVNRVYRYDLHAIAPTTAVYNFAYAGARLDGDDVTYLFRTKPAAARSFAVDKIEVDGRSFLPKLVHFKISNGSVHGSGQIAYARVETYWVVMDARVTVHLQQGALAHEHIKWSNYQFPSSLPPSTFRLPRVILAPEPDATATATAPALPGAP
jgi:hypothetical protein